MNIESLNNDAVRAFLVGRIGQDARTAAKSEVRPSDKVPADIPVAAPVEHQDDGDSGARPTTEARGVVRLLEEGHFKGVADVRLRINFFDELSSRAQDSARPIVTEQSAAVVNVVDEHIGTLVEALAPEAETRDAVSGVFDEFKAGVHDAVENANVGETAASIDLSALSGAIQAAFDGLFNKLDELLAPSAPIVGDSLESLPEETTSVGEPVDETTPSAPSAPLQPSRDELLASLKQAFDEALQTLSTAISTRVTLADPSSPTGHGAAYDKFLAVYDALRGTTASVNEVI